MPPPRWAGAAPEPARRGLRTRWVLRPHLQGTAPHPLVSSPAHNGVWSPIPVGVCGAYTHMHPPGLAPASTVGEALPPTGCSARTYWWHLPQPLRAAPELIGCAARIHWVRSAARNHSVHRKHPLGSAPGPTRYGASTHWVRRPLTLVAPPYPLHPLGEPHALTHPAGRRNRLMRAPHPVCAGASPSECGRRNQ